MAFDIVWVAFEGRIIAISSINEAWNFPAVWPGGLHTEMAHLAGIALTGAEAVTISTNR
jgi:hypothetical protein